MRIMRITGHSGRLQHREEPSVSGTRLLHPRLAGLNGFDAGGKHEKPAACGRRAVYVRFC